MMRSRRGTGFRIGTAAVACFAIAGCGDQTQQPRVAGGLVDDAAIADQTQAANWLSYGRTSSETRFSPLTEINDTNIDRLGVAWLMELPNDRGLVSTPLVVDGTLYFIGSMNIVRAVNAATGELLWTYDPQVRDYADRLRVGWDHSRGLAYWGDKIYLATWDGRLKAVDAATGREVWSATTIDPDLPLFITGAPKVFKGKVIIGNGGAEHGPARGYVTAYDAETGEQAWRFYTVPGNPADGFENDAMRMAAETWTGEWWVHGGGGTAWHGFTFDAELDQLYIGTGNGAPWNRKIRSPDGGDNLFLSSILALDPDTGEYIWHYQTTPGETWDFNSNMDIVLADLEIDGEVRKALMHAPKNGFFYVIDRTDGTVISAEPFVEVTWASGVDLETGRPIENPEARFVDRPAAVRPGPLGGHNWHAMSFNPETGLAYFPSMHIGSMFADETTDYEGWRSEPWVGGTGTSGGAVGSWRDDGALSTLTAWDPVRQELAWEVPLPGLYSAGTLTTAGNLVFHGKLDGTFAAYAADTGEEVWQVPLGLGVSAPAISYAVDGRQYIALLVGWGGVMSGIGGSASLYGWSYEGHTRMLVAFALDESGQVIDQPPPEIPMPIEADFDVDPELAELGSELWIKCYWCHGGGAVSGGMTPDLRASRIVPSLERFAGVVRDGERAGNGMPAYADITYDELVALQHYIRDRAEAALSRR